MKILLVEDNEPIANMLLHYLGVRNHEVMWVDSISMAREHLASAKFDGIICDGTLDDDDPYDGFRFVQELLKQDRKVVLFSSMRRDDVPEDIPFVPKNSHGVLEDLIKKLQST